MFSVTLNEAIELRQGGLLEKAYQALRVSSALCLRLTDPLSAMLQAFSKHAGHYGTAPSVAPLDPVNFQSTRGKSCAKMNHLLSCVLLTQRANFLYKIGDLQELVEYLGRDFCHAVEELVPGANGHSAGFWEAASTDHFDLNTCLRESFVLLKSFLRALPEEQLAAFKSSVTAQMDVPCAKATPRPVAIRHRRTHQFASE